MNERAINHSTFVIKHNYIPSPERVFAAWSDASTKAQWFPEAAEFDFQLGGREIIRGGTPGGSIYTFGACYQEFAHNNRIIYTYIMDLGETRKSVSVTTVEIRPADTGTQLFYTKQGAFPDGHDAPEQREHRTKYMLDKLGDFLKSE